MGFLCIDLGCLNETMKSDNPHLYRHLHKLYNIFAFSFCQRIAAMGIHGEAAQLLFFFAMVLLLRPSFNLTR